MIKWEISTLIESVAIGTGFGGWASVTYWPGISGVAVGMSIAGFAFGILAIVRHDEERKIRKDERKRRTKPYRDYGKIGKAA